MEEFTQEEKDWLASRVPKAIKSYDRRIESNLSFPLRPRYCGEDIEELKTKKRIAESILEKVTQK
jgi:hypothetical protein